MDGTALKEVVVEYPLGHKRRRAEGIPLLEKNSSPTSTAVFQPNRPRAILDASLQRSVLEEDAGETKYVTICTRP